MKVKIECDNNFLFGIQELQSQLNFCVAEKGFLIIAKKIDGNKLIIESEKNQSVIYYPKDNTFFRGFALALAHIGQKRKIEVELLFREFGTMQDCSDGLMSVEGLCHFIRQSALMGYTYIGLYTETTYTVEGEKYFGYKTGRYTHEELSIIVGYAEKFNIEVVPFIQTLGHMRQLFKWGDYYEISDLHDILLADYDKTYQLIENMIKSIRALYKTDRIHLGMDESYFMGAGRYRWFINEGEYDRIDLFIEHLKRVLQIAQKYNFTRPAIWCDTIFEMKFKGYIYPPEEIFTHFSREFVSKFPKVQLTMWNYSVTETAEFNRAYRIVSELTDNISFAGICHGFASFAPENYKTARMVQAVKEGCLQNGIKDILVTRWETLTPPCCMLAGFYDYIERCSETLGYDKEEHCKFLFGYTYQELLTLDIPNKLNFGKEDLGVGETNPAFYALVDDVLMGIMDKHIPEDANVYYQRCAETLGKLAKRDSSFAYLFQFEEMLCKTLAKKAVLSKNVKKYYDANDKKKLKKIARSLNSVAKQCDRFYKAYKNYWLTYNKIEGFELFDMRFGGLQKRLMTVKERLLAYCNGKIDKIEELEEERLPLYSGGENAIVCNKDWNGIAIGRLTRL